MDRQAFLEGYLMKEAIISGAPGVEQALATKHTPAGPTSKGIADIDAQYKAYQNDSRYKDRDFSYKPWGGDRGAVVKSMWNAGSDPAEAYHTQRGLLQRHLKDNIIGKVGKTFGPSVYDSLRTDDTYMNNAMKEVHKLGGWGAVQNDPTLRERLTASLTKSAVPTAMKGMFQQYKPWLAAGGAALLGGGLLYRGMQGRQAPDPRIAQMQAQINAMQQQQQANPYAYRLGG